MKSGVAYDTSLAPHFAHPNAFDTSQTDKTSKIFETLKPELQFW